MTNLKYENVGINSDDEDNIYDEDTCSDAEILKKFKISYKIAHEAIHNKQSYILHLAASSNFSTICTGSSDNSINIYRLGESSLENVTSEKMYTKYDAAICNLKFFNHDEHMLLCGLANGKVSLMDLRTHDIIHSFQENTNGAMLKTITSFDINQNNRILCIGTDLIQNDVFILFYDIRQRTLMGGYWESHTDDITQIKFHPNNPNIFASGSTDGLLNLFDISNTTEDDALQSCYNTVSSVNLINWHKNVYDHDYLSVITHTNDLHIYDVEEAEAFVEFDRSAITKAIYRKSADDCNLINCHNSTSDEIITLAQSNFQNGECVRTVKLENKQLVPSMNLTGNKQIIRTSVYSHLNNLFITAGESGTVSLFRLIDNTADLTSDLNRSLKNKCKLMQQKERVKPY